MPLGWMLLAVAVTTAVTVLIVLAGFWAAVVKPFLNRKVEDIIEAANRIEPGVKRGVREGVEETLRDLPENTLKESSRQFRRFGSGLFENGLSSFLGETPRSSGKKSDD
jgi:nitrogen fixation/metabolism regulation signal transduction histidine kinase